MNIDRYNAIRPDKPLGDRAGADATIPIPATDSEAEHNRVRDSNDRDQQIERDGGTSRHNEGYDEAADGGERTPAIDRIVDEP